MQDAVDHDSLAKNPARGVKPLRAADENKEVLHVLTPDEIGRLLDVAPEPYRTLYDVAVGTGLRRGELLGLRWGDLHQHAGLLHVRRSLGRTKVDGRYSLREAAVKTRHSRRTVDLSPVLVQRLLALPAGDDPERDFVFRSRSGGPLDQDAVQGAFKRYLQAVGLPEIRFHDLQHTHASLLIAAGVHPKAIQARLGHASIMTTLNTYGHLMPQAFQGSGRSSTASFMAPIRHLTWSRSPQTRDT